MYCVFPAKDAIVSTHNVRSVCQCFLCLAHDISELLITLIQIPTPVCKWLFLFLCHCSFLVVLNVDLGGPDYGSLICWENVLSAGTIVIDNLAGGTRVGRHVKVALMASQVAVGIPPHPRLSGCSPDAIPTIFSVSR